MNEKADYYTQWDRYLMKQFTIKEYVNEIVAYYE